MLLSAGLADAAGVRYQVKPGETLFRIALRTGLSEAQIRQANPQIRGVTLYAGQTITIPPRPVPPGSFRVRQGESLKALARRLGVSEGEIRRANPEIGRQGSLNAGQILRLPAKVIQAQKAAAKRKLAKQKKAAELARQQAAARKLRSAQAAKAKALVAQKRPSRPTTHRVQFGETFFSIARRYGLNPFELQRINPRYAGNLLNVGTVLSLIPRPAPKVTVTRPKVVVRPTNNRASVWIWPVPGYGRVTSEFGWRTLNEQDEQHTGIDIGAPIGTPVVAARSGRVIEAVYDTAYGWGRTVVLQHPDGWKTRYAHLNSIAVQKGQLLRQGQSLGTVGATGRVTGAHLHFGVYRNAALLDPLAFYRQGD